MARSSAQSDFEYASPASDEPVEVELPGVATPVRLPRATLRSNEGSAFASKWMIRLTILMLIALAVLCAVGPHIPAGG